MMRRAPALAGVVLLLLCHYALSGCDGDILDLRIDEARTVLADLPKGPGIDLQQWEIVDGTRIPAGTIAVESGRIVTPGGQRPPRKIKLALVQRDGRRKVTRLRFAVRVARDGTFRATSKAFPEMDFEQGTSLVVTARLKGAPIPAGSDVEFVVTIVADEVAAPVAAGR